MERDRDRFIDGSADDSRSLFTDGSQSEQSEQYECSLEHGDTERGGTGDERGEGVWLSSGTSRICDGLCALVPNEHPSITNIET